MNVLMFTPSMHRFGTWYRVFNLARALVERGHSVRIAKVGLQRFAPREREEDGVSVVELPRLWGASMLVQGTRMPVDIAARILMPAIRRYDVIHAFTHHLNSLLPALIGRWIGHRALVLGDRDDLWTEGGLYGDLDHLAEWRRRADYRFHEWTERNMARWLGSMTVVSDDLMQRVLETGVDQ